MDERPLVVMLGGNKLRSRLEEAGFAVLLFETYEDLVGQVKKVQARVCLLSIRHIGDGKLHRTIRRLRRRLPFTDVIVWAPDGDPDIVREAFKAGARDVLLSGTETRDEADISVIASIVEDQKILPHLRRFSRNTRETWRFEGMISRSRKMWDVFETCVRTASTDAAVLILGETGTGKELVARAIHRRSGRSGRFVALNCGAVPETLIDSELFGHTRGAFTGASGEKQGLFRYAQAGTLFLDEIGNISLPAQSRLLRALQEDVIRPVGGDRELKVDARVIAATSRSLEHAVLEGTFREDLLYRLDVIRIVIPPLRERPEDIILLFEHFLRRLCRQYNLEHPEIEQSFLDALQEYEWPGNVRQLENYTERILLTVGRGRVAAHHFQALTNPFLERQHPAPENGTPIANQENETELDMSRSLDEVVSEVTERIERTYLEACLGANRGRVEASAQQAGISRRTLLRKMRHYEIDKRDFRGH